MTKENTSIQSLLAAAEQSIPNLDGHNIRVAERRILWSKMAQATPVAKPAVAPQVVELPEMVIDPKEIEVPDMEIDSKEIEVPEVEVTASTKNLVMVAKYLDKKIHKKANQIGMNRVVAGLRAMFRNCFNRAISINPDSQGKVTLDLAIGPDGQVTNVVASATGNVGAALECIKATAMTAKFDPPATGSSTVRIPVVFVKQ